MNNEPVAYVDSVWVNRPDLAMDLGIGKMFSRCQLSDHQIPLYTHPAETLTEIIEKNKPEIEKANAYIKSLEDEIEALKAKTLTDEEIKEAKREALKEYYSVLSYQDEFELSWIDELFAKAILKKASEK